MIGSTSKRLLTIAVITLAVIAGTRSPAEAAPRHGRFAAPVRLSEAWAASPGATVDGIAGSRELEIGRAALRRLRLPAESMYPGWTISFRNAKPNVLGMTFSRERRIEIYVRRGRSIDGIAHDVAHELGHVTDVIYNSDRTRARFLELRGLPSSTPWWTCERCTDLQVGAGDFAETFAAIVGPNHPNHSELGGRRDRATLAQIATEILPAGIATAASGADF